MLRVCILDRVTFLSCYSCCGSCDQPEMSLKRVYAFTHTQSLLGGTCDLPKVSTTHSIPAKVARCSVILGKGNGNGRRGMWCNLEKKLEPLLTTQYAKRDFKIGIYPNANWINLCRTSAWTEFKLNCLPIHSHSYEATEQLHRWKY